MTHLNMLTNALNFPTSRRELENEACVDLRVYGGLSGSWQYMLPCTIYSILGVTWFQPRITGYSDYVHLRLGNSQLRDQ